MPNWITQDIHDGEATTLDTFLERLVRVQLDLLTMSMYPNCNGLRPPSDAEIGERIARHTEKIVASGSPDEARIREMHDTHVRYTERQNHWRSGADDEEHNNHLRERYERIKAGLEAAKQHVSETIATVIDEYIEAIDESIEYDCFKPTYVRPEPITPYEEFRAKILKTESVDYKLAVFEHHMDRVERPLIEKWRELSAIANDILCAAREAGAA